MSEPVTRREREGSRQRFRARLILFVVSPVALLGVCYFLFVEYIAISQGLVLGDARIALRIGGAMLITLALVSAVASGYLLTDRVSRPIRMLLRLAESGEPPAGPGLLVHHRDWEVFLLYRRVQVLVQQNRAGAGALAELETLRRALDELREGLARTGQHGILAPLELDGGPLAEVAALLRLHRERLIEFFRDLKTRTEMLRAELDRLQGGSPGLEMEAGGEGGPAGADGVEPDAAGRGDAGPRVHPVDGSGSGAVGNGSLDGSRAPAETGREGASRPIREASAEIRRIGTVLALEVERVGFGQGPLGSLLERFLGAVERLEEIAETCDPPALASVEMEVVAGPEPDRTEMEARWHRLREDLESLERRLEEVEER